MLLIISRSTGWIDSTHVQYIDYDGAGDKILINVSAPIQAIGKDLSVRISTCFHARKPCDKYCVFDLAEVP